MVSIGLQMKAQEIQLVSLGELNEIIKSPSEKLKVINFWASWCKPCIIEMPHFEAINREVAIVYFVTLDHPDDIEKARRMVNKNSIKSNVILLDEPDADKFITSIDKDWSGAIPATLFVDARGNRYFHESAFDKPQLEKIVKKYSVYNK